MEKDLSIVTAVNYSRESEFCGIEHADVDNKLNAEDDNNVTTSTKNDSENFFKEGEKVSQEVKPRISMCEGMNKTSFEPIKSTRSSAFKKKRKRRKGMTPLDNEFLLTRKRVRYLLRRINFEQNLIDAYSNRGWKGLSLEKIRPEKELERAKSQILQCKLRIRGTFQYLDSLLSVGKLEENLFDDGEQIDSEEIFCAKCKSKDVSFDNDIILCDGNCRRGFHQKCLNPPLPTEEIPPEDEGWLCPACDCKVDCLDLLNEFQGSDLSIEDTWEKVFPEAAGVVNGHGKSDDSNYSSDDSEDFDYNPEIAPGGDPEEGSSSEDSDSTSLSEEDMEMLGCNKLDDFDLPSDDSEDDDYDPECSNPNNAPNDESDFTSVSDDFCAELSKMNAIDFFSDYKLLDGPFEAWEAAQKISTNVEPPPVMGTDVRQENTCSQSKKRHREEADGKASSSASEDEVESHKPTLKKLKENRITSSSRNFSKQAYQVLREAFKENQYPSRVTKENLAEELGTTVKKISKWFANARHSVRVSAKRSNLPGTSSTKSDKETTCAGTSTPSETAENNTEMNEWNAKNGTIVTDEGSGRNNIEGNAKVMDHDDMTKIGMTDLDQSRYPEAVNESTPDRTHLRLGAQHGADRNRITPSSRNFSKQAYQKLREAFKEDEYPTGERKATLAEELGASAKKISKWFTNARHNFRVSVKRCNLPGTFSTKFDKETNHPGTSTPCEGRMPLTDAAENNTLVIDEGIGRNNVEGNAENTVANGGSGNAVEG